MNADHERSLLRSEKIFIDHIGTGKYSKVRMTRTELLILYRKALEKRTDLFGTDRDFILIYIDEVIDRITNANKEIRK